MKKIFVDTDIIISFTKGHLFFLRELIEKQNNNLIKLNINPVVVAEFFTDKNLRNNNNYLQAEMFFQNFEILSINKRTGLIAGQLLRDSKTNAIGDALIASTCLENKLELFTNNQKDFKKVKGLRFFLLE